MADTKYFEHIFRYLDINGDGSGNENANGNYSVTPETFYIQPPEGEIYEIHRLVISIEDTNNFQAEEYGDLGSALTNGIQVRLQDDSGTISDYTNGSKVKTNAQWGGLCYDVDVKSWGAGNELLVARITFVKAGQPILLRGDHNERLEIVLSDNLSGLISHQFMAQGLNITSERDMLSR